mgnify:CR=1 FL=1
MLQSSESGRPRGAGRGAIEPQAWECRVFENGRITRHIDKLVAIMVPPFDTTLECFEDQMFVDAGGFVHLAFFAEGVDCLRNPRFR